LCLKLIAFAVLLSLTVSTLYAEDTHQLSAWRVLSKELTLDHHTHQPEVKQQITWLINHPRYIRKLIEARPYIYHIIEEIKKRHLPGELALLPMLESMFNPLVSSQKGAAGLWQLMPLTGRELGLMPDPWVDPRLSIRPSTDAALTYLAYLNKGFNGNWLFTIAAYDAGRGNVIKSMPKGRAFQSVNFWTLPLPTETKRYIPRLLALAQIIKYPDYYHVKLPYIPYKPYFEVVETAEQISLQDAAKLIDTPIKELVHLNPGYKKKKMPPYEPHRLLIPAHKLSCFKKNIQQHAHSLKKTVYHVVKLGDSLSCIAKAHQMTLASLKKLNPHLQSHIIKPGQKILLA